LTAGCCMPSVRMGWLSAKAGALGASSAIAATAVIAVRLIVVLQGSWVLSEAIGR
jgi:hypothetical protein